MANLFRFINLQGLGQRGLEFAWYNNCYMLITHRREKTFGCVCSPPFVTGLRSEWTRNSGGSAPVMPMTSRDLLLEVDKILGLRPGTLRGDERLDELENWDSTALISFVALAEGENGVQISPVQIVGCSTVDDLLRLAVLQGSTI
jgi:acyl carrier protein